MATTKRVTAKKELHAHGCRQCRLRYEDACRERTEDGLCIGCRGGRPWQLLIANRAPQTCCNASRLATRDEKNAYCLAGRSNWHICPSCRRTHPNKPIPEENRP